MAARVWRAAGGHDSPAARRFTALCALAGALALGAAIPGATNVDGPLPAHTGGFGEPTCRACHVEYPLNEAGGTIHIEGLPDAYAPGERYRFTVTVRHAELRRAGFQLTFRHAGGEKEGQQAGIVTLGDTVGTAITRSESGVQYVHHRWRGTDPVEPGMARWTLEWTAHGTGEVLLHVAANVADDNNSELGDRIYTLERRIAVAR